MTKQGQLMSAAQFGNLAKVKQLVKSGVDINANQDEALMMSAANGHLEIVKYLLKKKCKYSCRL